MLRHRTNRKKTKKDPNRNNRTQEQNDSWKQKAQFLEEITAINKNYNTELIGRAFDTAKSLHDGQLRKSGEPYLIHPIAVAIILAELGMDDETIVGGLLHDVVEDTEYTREQLVEDFSEEIALLVDGVTKLGAIKFDTKEEAQAENLRKMFLAMSKDIRVPHHQAGRPPAQYADAGIHARREEDRKVQRNSGYLRTAGQPARYIHGEIRTGGYRAEIPPSTGI